MENRGTIDRQKMMQMSMCNKTARGHETAAQGYSSLHFISSHLFCCRCSLGLDAGRRVQRHAVG